MSILSKYFPYILCTFIFVSYAIFDEIKNPYTWKQKEVQGISLTAMSLKPYSNTYVTFNHDNIMYSWYCMQMMPSGELCDLLATPKDKKEVFYIQKATFVELSHTCEYKPFEDTDIVCAGFFTDIELNIRGQTVKDTVADINAELRLARFSTFMKWVSAFYGPCMVVIWVIRSFKRTKRGKAYVK